MSCQKRKQYGDDPDDEGSCDSKRLCISEDSSSSDLQPFYYDSPKQIRTYTDEERARVLAILESEFDRELEAKEDEILEIEERIHKTQQTLQYLCYTVVSDFYSREKTISTVASTRQRRIHPAVKKLLSGKAPPGTPEQPRNVTIPEDTLCDTRPPSASCSNSCSSSSSTINSANSTTTTRDSTSAMNCSETASGKEQKVPRYIPPKPKKKSSLENSKPVRGGQNKVKKTLVIGNVSKWLPPDTRDDAASHKWMVYVRGPKEAPDISGFVAKVRFFLHPSYRPNDVVQVVCPPFQLSRRGWGEFPVRVQIHFTSTLNKPVDIIHHLKLDRTYTGLQTLGAETIVEVWLHQEDLRSTSPSLNLEQHSMIKTEKKEKRDDFILNHIEDHSKCDRLSIIKSEPEETVHQIEDTSHGVSDNVAGSDTRISNTVLSQKNTEWKSLTKLLSIISDTSSSKEASVSKILVSTPTSPKKCAVKHVKPVNNLVLSPNSNTVPPIYNSTASSKKGVSLVKNPAISSQTTTTTVSNKPLSVVRCIDSKGNVRLVQMTPEMMAKMLKGNVGGPAVASPTDQTQIIVSSDLNSAVSAQISSDSPQTQPVVSPVKLLSKSIPANAAKMVASTSVAPGPRCPTSTVVSPGKVIAHSTTTGGAGVTNPILISSAQATRPHLLTTISPSKLFLNQNAQGLRQQVQTLASPPGLVSSISSLIRPGVTTAPSPTQVILTNASVGAQQEVPSEIQTKLVISNSASGIKTHVSTTSSPPKLVVSCSTPGMRPQLTSVVSSPKVVGTPIMSSRSGATVTRPVLRFVRPAGDGNARPMLVANSAGQATAQQMLARLPASSNGSRPLLMLKDGKLYVMKQSVTSSDGLSPSINAVTSGSASKAVTPSPASFVSVGGNQTTKPLFVTQSGQQVHPATTSEPGRLILNHTNMPSSDPSRQLVICSATGQVKTTLITTVNQPITSSIVTAPRLCAATKQSVLVQPTVSSPVIAVSGQVLNQNSQSLLTNPSVTNQLRPASVHLKPRASVGTPSVVRQPGPKALFGNEQVVQVVNGNSVIVQRVPAGQGSTAASVRPAVKPGMSLLKSGVSLLKSNVGSPVASASSSPVVSPSLSPCPSPVVFHSTPPPNKRVILGRSGGPSTITSTSHRARIYRELLTLIVNSCPREPKTDIWRAVRWLIRNLPLVNSEALHLEYKILHPYSAPDKGTFCSWNIGKQRACELLRAKTVHRLLREIGWSAEDVWTTKEVAVWARFHGYTPGLPTDTDAGDKENKYCQEPGNKTLVCKYTPPAFAVEWIAAQKKSKSSGTSQSTTSDSSDEEIDIVSCETSPSRVQIKQEQSADSCKISENLEEIPLEAPLQPIAAMVTDTLNRVGLKLAPEELVPGVVYPAAQRVLVQVVKSLAEDLTRRAFANAWGPCIARQPCAINVSNVCGAILERPEFDVLTCAGLGVNPATSVKNATETN